MSELVPMKTGMPCVVADVTTSTQAKALGNNLVPSIVLYNAGPGIAFFNSGDSTITITAPTALTGQNCSFLPPGFMGTYTKNNAKDTHLACIGSAACTLYIQTGEGV